VLLLLAITYQFSLQDTIELSRKSELGFTQQRTPTNSDVTLDGVLMDGVLMDGVLMDGVPLDGVLVHRLRDQTYQNQDQQRQGENDGPGDREECEECGEKRGFVHVGVMVPE
jgi:hypothetical protein